MPDPDHPNASHGAESQPDDWAARWAPSIRQHAFRIVPAVQMMAALGEAAADDWPAFAAAWNNLELDDHMADGGRYRRRRYATMSVVRGDPRLHLEPHQAHYQSLIYNPLNGGVPRHFLPIDAALLEGTTLQAALRLGAAVFTQLNPAPRARIEVHQFRIEARPDAPGLPTPEGAHRDGVDFVLVMLVCRHNISSGTTEIFDTERRPLDRFTLTEPGDAVLIDDTRVLHGVTPVTPLNPTRPAWRDVLVATYQPFR